MDLAVENPARLFWMLRHSPSLFELTFAAEAAGMLSDSEAVRSALMPLLGHSISLVREGAIYGLARHLNDSVMVALRELAQSDPSPGVREAAKEVL